MVVLMKVVIGVLNVCAATISYLNWARHIGNIVSFSYFLGSNWCCLVLVNWFYWVDLR